jgi:hypothetical protein
MFSAKSSWLLATSAALITFSYVAMALDPVSGGMGTWTLWIAPPALMTGFLLPIVAIIGIENLRLAAFSKRLRLQHLIGGLAFLIAFSVYVVTLEPTASLWDCSEFIASAYKLQVPHTPGTPLSLLFGRLFSMFAPDATDVAWTINLMSALFSALSGWLVYHIIYYFGDKILVTGIMWRSQLLILASIGGSLCLAFSDTFWFSAVEAETYGIACFFLLAIVWLILKGLEAAEPLRSRVFVLIGYVSGLAYCFCDQPVFGNWIIRSCIRIGSVDSQHVDTAILFRGNSIAAAYYWRFLFTPSKATEISTI